MNSIIALLSQPCRQIRRKRHVDEEFHASARRRKLDGFVVREEGSIAERLIEVFRLKIGIGREDPIATFSCSHQSEEPRHRKPEAADAWLSRAHRRIDSDPSECHRGIMAERLRAREALGAL
jgi:hypothetical protein